MGKSTTNYNPKSATPIKFVPQVTEFFDTWPQGWKGALSRTWILFFESLGKTTSGAAGPYLRTLLIKDTTAGTNIADNVPIYNSGTGLYVVATLRKAIASNLVVAINLNGSAVCTVTVPSATPVYPNPGCVIFTNFTVANQPFAVDALAGTADVLGATITSSDGSKDADGVCSFTVIWGPAAT